MVVVISGSALRFFALLLLFLLLFLLLLLLLLLPVVAFAAVSHATFPGGHPQRGVGGRGGGVDGGCRHQEGGRGGHPEGDGGRVQRLERRTGEQLGREERDGASF